MASLPVSGRHYRTPAWHADPADRRVKALVLTPAGERLRDQFWRNLLAGAGPLTPL